MELIEATYRLTNGLPTRELYGLTSQMRKAAISVAANIAEGHARSATKDYLRFLAIANGSLRELETYWDIAFALEYLTKAEIAKVHALGEEIGKRLAGLTKVLRRKVIS